MYVNNHKKRYKVGGLHLFRSERAKSPDSVRYSYRSSYEGQEKCDRFKDRASYSGSRDQSDDRTTLTNQLHISSVSTNDDLADTTTFGKDMVNETLDAIKMNDQLLKFQFSETSKLEQSNETYMNKKNSYSVSGEKQRNARAIDNCDNSEFKIHENDKAYVNCYSRLSNSEDCYSGQSNNVDCFNGLSKNVNCYSGLSNTVDGQHSRISDDKEMPVPVMYPVFKKPTAAVIASQKIQHLSAQQHNNKIQDDQNVHKTIDIKGKRSHDQVHEQMSQAKVQRKMSVEVITKNNNQQCHSLSNEKKCRICNIRVHAIISHYVNEHPEREVFPSRLAPHVGTLLRSSQFVHTWKRAPYRDRNGFRQQCYFCDNSICLSKHDWIEHMTRHTGNYQYKCGDCHRKFVKNIPHVCKFKRNIERIPQHIFDEANLFAYLCDVCNFVRFEKTEMEKHLRCEHTDEVKKGFKRVLFLSFQDVETNVTGSTNETECAVHEMQEGISGEHIANTLPKNNDGKRLLSQIYDNQDSEPKKPKEKPIKPTAMRSSKQSEKCKICNSSVRKSLVNHYVNVHQNNDVYPCRVSPKVGDSLRKSSTIHKCERVLLGKRWKYAQQCYFCNKSIAFDRLSWIDHTVRHTGYYQFRCTTSSMQFARKTDHNCGIECNIEKIPQPQFEKENILGYVCECNYVRLRKTEMDDHIKFNQQCNNVTEFTLLSFPEHNGEVVESNEFREEELAEMSMAIENALQESAEISSNEGFVEECDNESSSSGVSVNVKNSIDNLKTPSKGGDISGQLEPYNKIYPHATSEKSFQGAQVEDNIESILKPNNDFLCDLYKCKAIECDTFSTKNAENMLIHLQYHEENVANTLYSSSDPPSWLTCIYCDAAASSCQSLVTHISNEHQSNVFQCPHCIYRSCAACNTIFHLKQFHQSESKSVMICSGKEKNYANEKALIKKLWEENVRPFRCTKGCDKSFYAMDAFIKHTKTAPNHSNTFQCQLCGFTTLIKEADKHLLCHKIAILQCIYCCNGYDDIERMKSHMCTAHPSQLPYICVRLTKDNEILTDEVLNSVESTLILHVDETPKSIFSFSNEMEKPDAFIYDACEIR